MKKSLSIVLAVLMLLAVIPLSATAAEEPIKLIWSNVEVEPPTITPTEGDFGIKMNKVTISGGKLWHIAEDGTKTQVPGTFSRGGNATYQPPVGDYYVPVKFYPADTSKYKEATLSYSAGGNYNPKLAPGTSWPVLKVIGKPTTLVTAPTVEFDPGVRLSYSAKYITGAVVNDASGNAVTGTWSFVNGLDVLYNDAEVEIQWKASGYETIKITAQAKAREIGEATLKEFTSEIEVDPGLTLKDVTALIDADVRNADNRSMEAKWWTLSAEGYTEDALLQPNTKIAATATYKNPAATNVLTETLNITVLKAPRAVIEENPKVSMPECGYVEKVSDLIISGGKTNVPGEFKFDDPDKAITRGQSFYYVDITFYPTDREANETASCRPYTTVQIPYKFLDGEGNETVPVIKYPYGTYLKDSSINFKTIFGEFGYSMNDTTGKYSFYAPDGKSYIISGTYSGWLMPVGQHEFEIVAKPFGYTIYQTPEYANTTLKFIIEIEPSFMNVTEIHQNTSKNELTVYLDTEGILGTFDIFVEGTQIATGLPAEENYGTAGGSLIKTTWVPTSDKNAEYDIKVVYNPIEEDPLDLVDFESTFNTVFFRNITCDFGTLYVNGDQWNTKFIKEGDEIKIHNGTSGMDDFISWIIKDNDGNTVDVGTVYDAEGNETDLSSKIIVFSMPDTDLVITYKTQAMIDEEIKQEAIKNCDCLCHYTNPVAKIIWKIISFFIDLFGLDKECACGYAVHGK